MAVVDSFSSATRPRTDSRSETVPAERLSPVSGAPIRLSTQIVILGGGFASSLTALILHRVGFDVLIIDSGHHPRFVIGESSTPTANLLLRDLATKYDLPRLLPLCKYGPWKEAYPQLVCGIKRGFSYFPHRPGQEFATDEDHSRELLVAASADDYTADTHWLRSDFDSFLAREAQNAGIPFWEDARVESITREKVWFLGGQRDGQPWQVQARFIIDASGQAGVLLRQLGVEQTTDGLNTNSWSLFGHFAGLTKWADMLDQLGISTADHPFPCDQAAVHQLIDGGWMWQLRFDNGVTSAGFALDGQQHSFEGTPQTQWQSLLSRYPTLQRQFARAELVNPPEGLKRMPRMQRRARQLIGAGWAVLPNTAGFIDPLHSPGNAQLLCGVERLTTILIDHWGLSSLSRKLRWYETQLRFELGMIDDLIASGYRSGQRFRCFSTFAMLYFVAATTYERQRLAGKLPTGAAFLRADEPRLRLAMRLAMRGLDAALAAPDTAATSEQFEREVRRLIEPFNEVGLLNPDAHGMYARTAVVE